MSTIPATFISRLKELSRGSFNLQKCKMSVMLVITHIKRLKNKKCIEANQMKEEIAHFLRKSQDEMAFVQVEHLIKEEEFITVCDLICLYCHFIVARLQIMKMNKNCPLDLKEAISGIIFASQRCDIPGLSDLRHHFLLKYGQEFLTSAIELRPSSGVNPLMVKKLSQNTPETKTKIRVLNSIANDHGINWEPQSSYNDEEHCQNTKIWDPKLPTSSNLQTQNGSVDGSITTMASNDDESTSSHEEKEEVVDVDQKKTIDVDRRISSPRQEKSENYKHVHPKLPNADTLYSYFKFLRSDSVSK